MCVSDEHLFDEENPVSGEVKSAAAPRKRRSKKKEAAAAFRSATTFEDDYARLEAIIAEIERPDLPLQELIAKFEEGVRLIRQCTKFLQEARLRIEEHIEEKNGTYTLKDLPVEEPD